MKCLKKKMRCPKCTCACLPEHDIENTEQLLHLMDIYLSEWQHRDAMLWKQVFTYFYATLIVMILPYAQIVEISFGNIIPQWAFPLAGIIMSVAFFIIGKGYAVRLTAIGMSYDNLIQKLPEEYRRIKLQEVNPNSLANARMAYFIVYLMSALLMAVGIALLVLSMV